MSNFRDLLRRLEEAHDQELSQLREALRQLAEEGEKDGGEDDKDKEEVSKYAEMEVFPQDPSAAFAWVQGLTSFYWFLDIFVNMNTAIYSEKGEIDMRRWHIVRAYARSWLIFDVLLISLDVYAYMANLFNPDSTAAGAARSGRIARFMRIIRLLRLVRLAKLRQLLFALQSLIDSEWVTLMLAVVRNLAADCWVPREGIQDAEMSVQYMVSIQWSLAQFTPGASLRLCSNAFDNRCDRSWPREEIDWYHYDYECRRLAQKGVLFSKVFACLEHAKRIEEIPLTIQLEQNSWSCEAALWLVWRTRGEMRSEALAESDALVVNSKKFREASLAYPAAAALGRDPSVLGNGLAAQTGDDPNGMG
ncbi:Hypothetical protein (Fragment) [Durusdinium trenchii]|uniref:Ion transport domain-containing protein n=1 Tax=Durusdinium trenchii TaxID=1381693 RepID=A0ABP0IHD5_9DINO